MLIEIIYESERMLHVVFYIVYQDRKKP